MNVTVHLVECEALGHWYVGIPTAFQLCAEQHRNGVGGVVFAKKYGLKTSR